MSPGIRGFGAITAGIAAGIAAGLGHRLRGPSPQLERQCYRMLNSSRKLLKKFLEFLQDFQKNGYDFLFFFLY
jgi:hypothetical protein